MGIVLLNMLFLESVKVDDVVGVFSVMDVDGDSVMGYVLVELNDFFYLKYENGIW